MDEATVQGWIDEVTEKLDEFNKGSVMEAYDYLSDIEAAVVHALSEGLGKRAFDRVRTASIAMNERLRWPFLSEQQRKASVSWGMELDLDRLHKKTKEYVNRKGSMRGARTRFTRALLSHPGMKHVLNDMAMGDDGGRKGVGSFEADDSESEGEEEETEALRKGAERDRPILTPEQSFLARVEGDLADISAENLGKKGDMGSKDAMINSIMDKLPGWSEDIFGPYMGASAAPSAARSGGKGDRGGDDGGEAEGPGEGSGEGATQQRPRTRVTRRHPRRRPIVTIVDEDEEGRGEGPAGTPDKGKEPAADDDPHDALPGVKERFTELEKLVVERLVKAKVPRRDAEYVVEVMSNVTDQDDMKMEFEDDEWVLLLTYKTRPSDEVANEVRIDLTTAEGMEKLRKVANNLARERIKNITVIFVGLRAVLKTDSEVGAKFLKRLQTYLFDPFEWKWSDWDWRQKLGNTTRGFLQIVTKVSAILVTMYISVMVAWTLFEILNKAYGSGQPLPHDFIEVQTDFVLRAMNEWTYSIFESIGSKAVNFIELPFLSRMYYSFFMYPMSFLPWQYTVQHGLLEKKKAVLEAFRKAEVAMNVPEHPDSMGTMNNAYETLRDYTASCMTYEDKTIRHMGEAMRVVNKHWPDPATNSTSFLMEESPALKEIVSFIGKHQQCGRLVVEGPVSRFHPTEMVCVDIGQWKVRDFMKDYVREGLPDIMTKLERHQTMAWSLSRETMADDAREVAKNKKVVDEWIDTYSRKVRENVSDVKKVVDSMTSPVTHSVKEDWIVQDSQGFKYRLPTDDKGLHKVISSEERVGLAANLMGASPFKTFTFLHKVYTVCSLLDISYSLLPKLGLTMIWLIAKLVKACFRSLGEWLRDWIARKMRVINNTSEGYSLRRRAQVAGVWLALGVVKMAQAFWFGIEWVSWTMNLMMGVAVSSPKWILLTMSVLAVMFSTTYMPEAWKKRLFFLVNDIEGHMKSVAGMGARVVVGVLGIPQLIRHGVGLASGAIVPEAVSSTVSEAANYVGKVQSWVLTGNRWVLDSAMSNGAKIAETLTSPAAVPTVMDEMSYFEQMAPPGVGEAPPPMTPEMLRQSMAAAQVAIRPEGGAAFDWMYNMTKSVCDQMPTVSSESMIDQAFRMMSETTTAMYAQASDASAAMAATVVASMAASPFLTSAALVAGTALTAGVTYHSVKRFRSWYKGERAPKNGADKTSGD